MSTISSCRLNNHQTKGGRGEQGGSRGAGGGNQAIGPHERGSDDAGQGAAGHTFLAEHTENGHAECHGSLLDWRIALSSRKREEREEMRDHRSLGGAAW
ncbi:MAG: hypothetical protein HQL96_13200 [Magnetococcales bacterium]|nr:hypothetical protein [Magnetococcales bacterium]